MPDLVITPRVDENSGVFGNSRCENMPLKTRNYRREQLKHTLILWNPPLTCHTNGKFLIFNRTRIIAMTREVLPGPVKVFNNRALTPPACETPYAELAATVAAIPAKMILIGTRTVVRVRRQDSTSIRGNVFNH